ncbi:MAG: hypothetical protein MRZ37_03640 [Tenericutes bacterium]|nr:hypothetical protein [Mycoplasmatota bacterium]
MKQIEYFLDFYKSLNTPGMVLFWLIVVLFFFLFFSLIAVLLKNQELRKIIIKMRTEEKKNKVEDKTNFKDNVRSLSIKKEDYQKIKEEDLKENAVILNNEDIDDGINDEVIEENDDVKENIEEQKLEPIEVVENIEEEIVMPKYEKEEIEENSFVEEIKRQVDEEIDDGPIALTDFENSQEEDAIISYEELLRNAKMAETRENRYDIDIDDDNDFLKELKSFRSNL